MVESSERSRIDWGLLLIIVIASQGLSAFITGDPVEVTLALTSLIMAFFVVREPGHALQILFASPLVFFFAAWSLVAALISPRPAVALSLSLGPVLTIVYAGVRRLTTERLLLTFAIGTTVALVPSAIGRVSPIFGPVLTNAGAAQGYAGYFGWNSAAGLCAAAALLSLAALLFLYGFHWWVALAAGMAALMLQQSKSATAALALATAAGVAAGQAVFRRADPEWRLFALASIAIGTIFLGPAAVAYLADLTWLSDLTDRTRSLSGRTTIWQWARQGVAASPYWGHGTEFWKSVGAWNRSGHNGFVDIALKSGLPAALAFVAAVAVSAVRVRKSALLPLMIFGVIANLAVSNLAVTSIPSLALLLTLGVSLGRSSPADTASHPPGRPLARQTERSLSP